MYCRQTTLLPFYLILLEILHMPVASSCYIPYCRCTPSTKSASCSGLGYIPQIPQYVKTLELIDNTFSQVSRQFIWNITENNLSSITFFNNSVRYFSNDVFQDFLFLRTLNISNETFVLVENVQNVLNNIRSKPLQSIIFEANEWTHIPQNMFADLQFSNLTFISLANNVLTEFKMSSFLPLKRLHRVCLLNNRILQFTPIIRNPYFPPSSPVLKIEKLNLAENHIVTLPTFCLKSNTGMNYNISYVPNLKRLDVSGNAINNLESSLFNCLPSLEYLILNSNRFVVLRNNVFKNIPNLKTLFIQEIHKLKTIEKFALVSPSLSKLHFAYNDFQFDKTMRKRAQRFYPKSIFKYLPSLEYLNLRNNHMPSDKSTLSVMFKNLRNVKILILQAVKLRELHEGVFQHLKALQRLTLQGNHIEFWRDGTFDNLHNLKYLNIQNNRVHLFNKTSISPSILNSLEMLDLSRNPFSCTCDSMWFHDWIRTTNVSLSNFPNEYKCTYPTEMLGELFIEYKPTKEECTPWNPLFTVAILLSSFGFVVVVLILAVYKCHANIRNCFYLLRLRQLVKKGYVLLDNNDDFKFDAFVVYCDDDRDWVHRVFLKELEEKGIRLCIHHREFMAGAPIIDNIDHYMSKSWKVVVIMSNAFASSEWCQWELDVVQGRRRRQGKDVSVLIMLKAIDAHHMTSSIKTLLQTTPYLRYRKGLGQELFWQTVADTLRRPLNIPPIAI